jgi:hypothetical protein
MGAGDRRCSLDAGGDGDLLRKVWEKVLNVATV